MSAAGRRQSTDTCNHVTRVEPAMDAVKAVMKELQNDADILGKSFGLRIIVGKGNGSVNNIPKIKNAFLSYLEDMKIEWSYPDLQNDGLKNEGLVAIVFHPRKLESADLLS
jgi:hypothetical protein